MAAQTLSFSVSYNVDSELLLSVEEYLSNYMTDIPLRGLGGERMTSRAVESKIRLATEQLEGILNLKIPMQRIEEQKDFEREYFVHWGFIHLNYPVVEVNSLTGKLNYTHQIEYPSGWINTKRELSKIRNIYLIPSQNDSNGASNNMKTATFNGNSLLYGFSNSNYIPNYWHIDYISGFDKVPSDIVDAACKFASMQILAILGDVSFGAGIASKSISMDGLSQSINTTQSAENSLYSARVRQFQRELKDEIQYLKNKYRGIQFTSL